MLKFLWTLAKLSIFAVLVLVVAHYVKLQGRTISDQVDTHIARAERMPVIKEVKNWTARTGAALKQEHSKKGRSDDSDTALKNDDPDLNEANSDERNELRRVLGN